MTEQGPLVARHHFHQNRLNLYGIVGVGKTETLGEPRDVRIDHNPFIDFERVAQHDVRRLSTHAGKLRQLLH